MRYDPDKRLSVLREDIQKETEVLARLRESLRKFKSTDKSGWTHYDYAHFQGTSKADIWAVIYRVESRIRDIRRQMDEAAGAIERGDDDEELVY